MNITHETVSSVFRRLVEKKRKRGTLAPYLSQIIRAGSYYLEFNTDDTENPIFISATLVGELYGTPMKYIGFTKKHPKDKQNIEVGLTRAIQRMLECQPQYCSPGIV